MPPEATTAAADQAEDRLARIESTAKALSRALHLDGDTLGEEFDLGLKSFRDFIHDLPASEAQHHSRPWGLLEHSLQSAFWATRIAIRGELSRYPRRTLRFFLVFGALLHDVGRVFQLVVRDPLTGKAWDPLVERLSIFASRSSSLAVDWIPERLELRPDTEGTALQADTFIPDSLRAIFLAHLPIATMAELFGPLAGAPGDVAEFARAAREIVRRADGYSRWDDRMRIDPVRAFEFAAKLRRAVRHLDTFVNPLPLPAFGTSSARELATAVILIARARLESNSLSEELAQNFRDYLGDPLYQLYVYNRDPHRSTRLRWGRRGKFVDDLGRRRPYLFKRFDESKVHFLARLDRYKPVFRQAEEARLAIERFAHRAARPLRHLYDRLAPFASPNAELPAALERHLQSHEAFTTAGVIYFPELLRRLLAFDAAYHAAYQDAVRVSEEARALFAEHGASAPSRIREALARLRAGGPVTFIPLPENLPPVGFLSSCFAITLDGLLVRAPLPISFLRRAGLSDATARAFSKVLTRLYGQRRILARFDRLRANVLSAPEELKAQEP